jgi:hypothetical protein
VLASDDQVMLAAHDGADIVSAVVNGANDLERIRQPLTVRSIVIE